LSPTAMRVIGITLLVAAAVLAILNLKRVANLGTFWVSSPLMILGMAFIILARRRR
jgi:phosphate/sulfate permease